jgi:hypothetical protein
MYNTYNIYYWEMTTGPDLRQGYAMNHSKIVLVQTAAFKHTHILMKLTPTLQIRARD